MTKRKQWLIGDLHFNHPNIIKYCKRPFKNVEEQDKYLINKINELCSIHDVLYHFGDFFFPSGGEGGVKRTYEYYENQIKPRIVHVKGNHDGDEIPTRVTEVIIRFDRERVLCIHDPAKVKITGETPRYIITGHIHDKNRMQRVSKYSVINVGVDVWNFQPIQFKDVMRVIKNYNNFFSGKDDQGKKLTYMPVINERWIKKAADYKTTGMWVADSETAALRGQ